MLKLVHEAEDQVGAKMPDERVFTTDDVKEFADICMSGDFDALKGGKIAPDTRYAPKGWSEDVHEEWVMLMRQYGPGPALCFAVCALTPLLRRDIDFDRNFANFNALWESHGDFLLKNLQSRWLISTLDTYIMCPRSPAEQAWAFMGAFFMKTIKLYESENMRRSSYPDLRKPAQGPLPNRMRKRHGRVMLFEGIQTFNVNAPGDMIEKMEKRLMTVESDELCYRICCELWRRAHQKQTIYRRMGQAVSEVRAERQRKAALKASAESAPVFEQFTRGVDIVMIDLPGPKEALELSIGPSSREDAGPDDREIIAGEGGVVRVLATVRGAGDAFSLNDIKVE
jgi:hypothetical protein